MVVGLAAYAIDKHHDNIADKNGQEVADATPRIEYNAETNTLTGYIVPESRKCWYEGTRAGKASFTCELTINNGTRPLYIEVPLSREDQQNEELMGGLHAVLANNEWYQLRRDRPNATNMDLIGTFDTPHCQSVKIVATTTEKGAYITDMY
jgi:hypothetical protein